MRESLDDLLGDPHDLEHRCIAIAVLDAILGPRWVDRSYSFQRAWAPHESMAEMHSGSADDWMIVFGPEGAYLRGFDHESPMSPYRRKPPAPWPGLFDDLPPAFYRHRDEPAFSHGVTFCAWWHVERPGWRTGNVELPPGADPDGSGWMLDIFDGGPEAYWRYATSYWGRDLPAAPVLQAYAHAPLSDDDLRALRSDVNVEAARAELSKIGYPHRA